MYREHAPTADPYGLYACVWSRSTDQPQEARIVPDACVDVIWQRESEELFVAGPDTYAHVGPIGPGTLIGVRFSPGSASAALGVPADLLRDARVPLDQVWHPATARRIAESLAGAGTDAGAQRTLEAALTAQAGGVRDPVAAEVLRLSRGGMRVGQIAGTTGLSQRQLHRRCLTAFGYGAKVLHRVLRFRHAVRLARSGSEFADIAYRVGYADQAHLAREVKALAGVPLTGLARG